MFTYKPESFFVQESDTWMAEDIAFIDDDTDWRQYLNDPDEDNRTYLSVPSPAESSLSSEAISSSSWSSASSQLGTSPGSTDEAFFITDEPMFPTYAFGDFNFAQLSPGYVQLCVTPASFDAATPTVHQPAIVIDDKASDIDMDFDADDDEYRPDRQQTLRARPRAAAAAASAKRSIPLSNFGFDATIRGNSALGAMAAAAPLIVSDLDYASLPTKRSRGRRPPVVTNLKLDVQDALSGAMDPNKQTPTKEQIEYAGTTKCGKVKKIFICKVPGCTKVFKRSEHLKRHLRSIHTNDKPYKCPWNTCTKCFSRSDNLAQHLRVHRFGTSASSKTLSSLSTATRLSHRASTSKALDDGDYDVTMDDDDGDSDYHE